MATIYLWIMLWTLLVANIVAAAVNFAGSRVDMASSIRHLLYG